MLPHPPAQLFVPTRPVPGWFSFRPRRPRGRRSRHTARHRQNFRCWPAISSWFARRIRASAARSMRRKSVRSPAVKPTCSATTSRLPEPAASLRGIYGRVRRLMLRCSHAVKTRRHRASPILRRVRARVIIRCVRSNANVVAHSAIAAGTDHRFGLVTI